MYRCLWISEHYTTKTRNRNFSNYLIWPGKVRTSYSSACFKYYWMFQYSHNHKVTNFCSVSWKVYRALTFRFSCRRLPKFHRFWSWLSLWKVRSIFLLIAVLLIKIITSNYMNKQEMERNEASASRRTF